jgi:hypothetical protein
LVAWKSAEAFDAVGFEASDPGDEGKELVVRGVFTASPGAQPAR